MSIGMNISITNKMINFICFLIEVRNISMSNIHFIQSIKITYVIFRTILDLLDQQNSQLLISLQVLRVILLLENAFSTSLLILIVHNTSILTTIIFSRITKKGFIQFREWCTTGWTKLVDFFSKFSLFCSTTRTQYISSEYFLNLHSQYYCFRSTFKA